VDASASTSLCQIPIIRSRPRLRGRLPAEAGVYFTEKEEETITFQRHSVYWENPVGLSDCVGACFCRHQYRSGYQMGGLGELWTRVLGSCSMDPGDFCGGQSLKPNEAQADK